MFNPVIEKDKKVIQRRKGIRGYTAALRALEINDSFLCDRKLQKKMHALAYQIGIKIITGKEGTEEIRVERLE